MPDGASKLRDVKQLSDAGAAFEYELAVAQLPGFPLRQGAGVSTGEGTVRARLRFGREQGWPAAQVALEAELEMTCQRCLRTMPVRVETDASVLLVESEQAAERGPEGAETFLAAEGRLSIAALVAEELMLALPIVPLHASETQCLPADSPPSDAAPPTPGAAGPGVGTAPVTRPFANLRALMERGGKSGN